MDFESPDSKYLLDALSKKRAMIVVGTGVSNATDPNARRIIGSWTALLKYGIQFCCEKCRKEPDWSDHCGILLDKADTSMDELLAIGDEIVDCLKAHGKFEEWLSVFNTVKSEERKLIQTIMSLGVPMATANYDRLLEDITGLTPITLLPKDKNKVESFIDTDQTSKYILHLHGYYEEPDSIVLGKKSYEDITTSDYAQFINRFLATKNDAIIFLGFGEGVFDLNFSLIFEWVTKHLSTTKMFHLVRNPDVASIEKKHQEKGNNHVKVLGYGDNYGDLEPLLRGISLSLKRPDDAPTHLPAAPECLGEALKILIDDIANFLTQTHQKPAGILGTGGIGKTNLALTLLHQPKIARYYAQNRFFVSCEGANSLDTLLVSIKNALLIPDVSTNLRDGILRHLSRNQDPKLIVLDNFETPYENMDKALEDFVEKLQDVADLAFTIRAGTTPVEFTWEAFKVKHLTTPEAVSLFDNESENKFVNETLVRTLVEEVDNLPLAITLLAKRARTYENIQDLYAEWTKRRQQFLKIKRKDTHKDYNLELSIALSYESKRLDKLDRAFLQALCQLPSGINRQDLNTIFDNSTDLIDTQIATGLAEETDHRIKVLAPIREYVNEQTTIEPLYTEKITDFYLDLAKENGVKVGDDDDSVMKTLNQEWTNIISLIIKYLSKSYRVFNSYIFKYIYHFILESISIFIIFNIEP